MRTVSKGACVAALVLAIPACSHATRITGIDVVSLMQRERIARMGPQWPEGYGTASLMRDILVDPASPYSDTKASPDLLNELHWRATLDALGNRVASEREALEVLYWDLGVTKAPPQVGTEAAAARSFRDPFVAAGARKADVDADIFWHMLDVTGYAHSTKAAYYAVALQILRRQMQDIVPERRAALGVHADVFARVMAARQDEEMSPHDLRYLSALVQHRMLHWRPGGRASTGLRELPVAYRIARIAAAYRDARGYFTGPPCHLDGSPVMRTAGTGAEGDRRDLCFAGATDRAVHRWYVEEVRFQAMPRPRRPPEHTSLFSAIALLALPLLEMAPVLEFVEAVVADELVAAEAIEAEDAAAATDRADLMTCLAPE
ncbi:hypothetical protein HBF26_06590 [Luteibacter jiangsuensis]|uniref:Uncharacterized protein n=1 Tax=Luteibacter jiangsuensis TaxID=637577 RepID=A0ABX0Q291_9GAMM|nr:hypothetical protein [Luteibacter jiangsuensis]NID04545.1 hypothetical protein [Luteibacter jiangsuensis]